MTHVIGNIFSGIFSRWVLLLVLVLFVGVKVYERVDTVGMTGLNNTIVSQAHAAPMQ